jgi:predicted dienelactone hydrolase
MRTPPLVAGLAGVLLLTALPASATAATRLALPAPTGPHAVGSTDLHLVDHARPDPWVAGTTRELMVTVRYPARSGGGPKAPYQTPKAAKPIAEEDARTLGIAADRLDYTFATHARTGVPAAGGRRPVVLYSPSAKYPRSVGTAQLEQLASEGYVTVAIDHTHEPVAVEFPGGRVERQVLPSGPAAGRQLIATRVADTRFVLDALETLAQGGNPDAERRPLPAGLTPDLSRAGMFGHSAGGFTTGETMVSDPRLDAGADLDGSMAYSQSAREFGRVADEGLDQPFLLLSAGNHSPASDASWQEFLLHQRGPVRTQHLPDGEHFSYTDYQVLLPRLGLDPASIAPFVGTVDPERSIATQRAALSAFFGRHLSRG